MLKKTPAIVLLLSALNAFSLTPHIHTTLVPEYINQKLIDSYATPIQTKIFADQANIETLLFWDKTPSPQKYYLGTAGAPGASKSTILEFHLQGKPNAVYLDPDQRALRFMTHTYLADLNLYNISQAKDYPTLLQEKYLLWRDASNYITNNLLNEAFRKGYNIAHGITATGSHMNQFYTSLKQAHYSINLLLCGSSDQNRINALTHRLDDQKFIQIDPAEIIPKGKAFYRNFPIYNQWADTIEFYWITNFAQGWTHTASYTKSKGLTIHHQDTWQAFKDAYHKQIKEDNNTTSPTFDELFLTKSKPRLKEL